jgi:hypothetical protein
MKTLRAITGESEPGDDRVSIEFCLYMVVQRRGVGEVQRCGSNVDAIDDPSPGETVVTHIGNYVGKDVNSIPSIPPT